MRIDWAVTCRYAESDGTLGTIVGAGADVIEVAMLPQPVAMMLAVRLAASAEEFAAGATHELVCSVLDPSGVPVTDMEGRPAEPLRIAFSAPAEGVQQRVSGWLVTPLFTSQIAWIARELGSFTIETRAADDVHRTPVHVVLHGA